MTNVLHSTVTKPPRKDANAIGIKMREAGRPDFRAYCNATGITMASAPIFFVTIDSSITAPASAGICSDGLLSLERAGSRRCSTRPEREIAALSSNAEAMIQIRSFPNPVNILLTGIRPSSAPATSAASAIRS